MKTYAFAVTLACILLFCHVVKGWSECGRLKRENAELVKRVLEWKQCAKHVLMQAKPEGWPEDKP